MPRGKASRVVVAAAMLSVAGWPISVFAQDAVPAPEPQPPADLPASPDPVPPVDGASAALAAAPVAEQPGAAQPADATAEKPLDKPLDKPVEQPAPKAAGGPRDGVKFNFKDAPVDQVLDIFARESGVPVIYEAAIPQGSVTFVSGSSYTFGEALSILNLNLARFSVHLRHEGNFLYLATLADSMKRAGSRPVDENGLAAMTPDQIVTVSIPLENAKADQVAEQVKAMIGPFGGVVAIPAQNLLIVVESVGQVRRIREVVESIDARRPADAAFRLFPLKHASCDAVLNALRGLISEKRSTVIVDKDGGQRVVQDQSMQGLNLASDPRTNSIVAVGPEAKIKLVEEVIKLLDVPEGTGIASAGDPDSGVELRTFSLVTVTPDEAARHVNALFASLDPKRRPAVLPLASAGKITLVGSKGFVAQASMLLSELDPGAAAGGGGNAERLASIVRLTNVTPAVAEGLLTRLGTPRVQQTVKVAPGPDGTSLIVMGPEPDVRGVEDLLRAIDVPGTTPRDVRLVTISRGEPGAMLERAQTLYKESGRAEREPVTASLDASSRTVTLVGSRTALGEFDAILSQLQATTGSTTESRRYTLQRATPSSVAGKASRLARAMLAPSDGGAYAEPAFDAADELGMLVVRAQPSQFQVLDALIRQLDAAEAGGQDVRVIRLSGAEPQALLARAKKLYETRVPGSGEAGAPAVGVEFDTRTGNVVLSGRPADVRVYAESLAQAQQLVPPARTTRVIDVRNTDAKTIVESVREMVKSADPIDPARAVPEPTIQVVERTNSLLVTAEDAQHGLVGDFIARLDRPDEQVLPALKLLQLRTADAPAIAGMLTEQYGKRPQAERLAKPVEVRADATTNTLIVSAHEDLFAEIRAFVEEINKEKRDQPERVTELFPLKVAKATDVATAMDRLFPEPPMPVDRLGRPQPWLRKPKDVFVSAEPNSNALILDASPERMESLKELAEKLDRVELPPQAVLRTFRVPTQSLEAVSRTLQSMASRGVLTEIAQPGKPPVQVLIEPEPKSGTLIVAGDAKTFETVEKLLKDLSLVPIEKSLRIFPVVAEKAGGVRERAVKIYDAQVAQVPGATPIEVTVDETSNSLMVVADAESMQRFARVMDELNRQAGPAREVRLIDLKVAKAPDVVGFLRDLVESSESFTMRGGASPVFEVIESTNQIMVAAQPSQMLVIESLARSLDSKAGGERPPMRIIRLRSTDAANLASVLQRSYDGRTPDDRGRRPVTIEADPATNTLIVSAHEDVLPEIEAIATQLNETQAADAEGREIRIFPLKVARAEELAQTIDQMYPDPPIPLDPRTRQPRPDLRPPREVVVRADRATNSLIVDAPSKRLSGFEQLVKSLDQAKLSDSVTVRTYRVQRADLAALSSTLRALASEGALGNAGSIGPVTISTDAPTRTLIVSGPAPVFKAVEEVLAKVDVGADLPPTDMKLYALTAARADRIATIVERVLTTRAREMRALEGKAVPEGERLVEVASDASSNTIIVSAPAPVLAVADGIIKALDQQSVASATEVRVFRLQKGDASGVAGALTTALKAQDKPGASPATVSAEPASNTVVVVGTSEQLDHAAKLVEQLDASVDREGLGVRSIPLKFARAEVLAPVLEGVLARESALDRMPDWMRAQVLSRGTPEPPRVRVVADPRLNALVVSGPRSVVDMAEDVVRELDVSGAGAEPSRAVRVITLRNADARELSQSLEAIFKDAPGGDLPPVIRVDSASNALVVRASDAQMKTVEELASTLDAAAVASSRQMRTIAVDPSRVDAELLARTLQRLMEQQGGMKVEVISTEDLLKRARPAGEAPAKPRTMDDRGSRRRGVSATVGAVLASIIGNPGALEAPATPAEDFLPGDARGDELPNEPADEPDAAPDDQPSEPPPAPVAPAAPDDTAPTPPDAFDAESGLTIAVDKSTNSIIVVGSPRQTDRLLQLARALESQLPAEPVGVRIVPTPASLDAEQIAQTLRQTVSQIGRMSPGNAGGFTGPVSVAVDPAGSSLIVLCNDTDFETVGTLLATFSATPAGGKVTIKVYPLANITAQRAIQSVQDLFSNAPRGAQARRVREVELSLAGEDGVVSGRLDPALVRLASDPGGAGLIVAAPDEAIPVIDRLIATIDQSPVEGRLAIRRYDVTHAKAEELARTFQTLFDAQRQGAGGEIPQARFIAEPRTNTLLVTASEGQHREATALLKQADAALTDPDQELAIITLRQAAPSTVRRIVDEVIGGRDPGRKERVQIAGDDGSSVLVVRASKDDLAEVRAIIAQVDQAETGGLPLRSIKLERANAAEVARALQQFFRERASGRAGARGVNRVAVVGDTRTGTIMVSAPDEEFEQVKELVRTFDTPAPSQDLVFKVVTLKHARVSEVSNTIKTIVDEMRWETMWGPREGDERVQVHIETNERTNSVVIVGRGETIALAEKVIATLDLPDAERAAVTVRSVKVRGADLTALRTVLQRAFATPGWRSWQGPDPEAITVEIDRTQRSLILVGKAERVKQAEAYVTALDAGPEGGNLAVESITLEHARADRAANSLRQFFADRARAQGMDQPGVSVVGSADGNVIIASGEPDNLAVLKDLVAQIDQPDGGKDRRVDVIVLRNGTAADVANSLRAMFARGTREDERVVITPQPSTNAVIISAPAGVYPEVVALLQQLDAAPKAEETNIETVALTSARAQDVAQALRTALPANVKVTVTPVVRSNSLMLTGSKEAIAIVLDQIKKIDTEPVRSGLVFRRFKLVAADASEVSYTVDQLLRARPKSPNEPSPSIDYARADNTLTVYAPADQIEEIETIVRELDQAPAEERTTEFVKLKFANATQAAGALRVFYGRFATEAASPAARNVTILPDALSNSLVIRADATQWEGIRALLAKLDTEEYDTTRQLAVIPLVHADATSVARALNEGLRAPLEEQLRQAQVRDARARAGQGQRPGDQRQEPTVLVDAEGVPTVSAEVQTNSLIVFAGGRELERIREIVRQLDVTGFADMPTPRIIPLKTGKPSAVAATIRDMYLNRPGTERAGGPRAVVIIGDDSTGALIVRADDEKFAQIKVLASTLEQQGEAGRVAPHVLRLKHIAAGRLRQTILATFTETARSQGETIAVEVDRSGNALVVACSPRLLEQVRAIVEELDRPVGGAEPGETAVPGLGQTVTIIDVANNDPADIRRVLVEMGVTAQQPADRPGVVSEAVTITVLSSRRAIAVVGAPGDGRAVEAVVRAIDGAPLDPQQLVMVVPVKVASAQTLAATLNAMLKVEDPASGVTGPARALAEQVRRLQMVKAGVDQPQHAVDLTKPVRVLADATSNSLIIASTQGNIDALREVVKALDTLAGGDAVVMRIFPLENAGATRLKTVIEQLFAQGEALRRLPGTQRAGVPPTATGQALAGEIAISVDERTNTMIVAGREEAVALVEVLVKDLDSDRVSKWVEPVVIALKHADAPRLAQTLNDVLVRGVNTSPEAAGLQRQFGRLRVAQDGAPAGAAPVAADLFAPVTGLTVTPEPAMNALIVVGTPANIQVIRAMVAQLDVAGASAANSVRFFPLRYAAADRVAGVLRDVFRQRADLAQERPEDRLIVTTDVRTNALVVSTSERGFSIVEGLLKNLDGEQTNFSVGLHVLPVSSGDVRQLAPRIERLMRERIQAAAQSGGIRNPLDAFSIEPDTVNNLLIVSCSDENLVVVKELLAAVTAGSDRLAQGERVDVVQLSRARAAEAAQSLTQLYVEKENERRGQGTVRVVPNERLNALIVSGSEQDIVELRALAKKIDSVEVAQRQQIKWIELKSANAGEVVRLLQSVLAGRPVSGGTSPESRRQATRLQFLRDRMRSDLLGQRATPPSEADIDGAIKDLVTLNADARTNSVWITAPEPMTQLISEMIEDIEQSSAGARKIEQFRLLNADAVRMRDLLRDIFQMRQQGDALVLVPSNFGDDPSALAGEGLSGSGVTPVPDERMALSIAVDQRTNSLIVSGTPEYLDLVRKVVVELDSISANDRERRVYQLRNAKAKEIELTLRSYFQGESDKERLVLGAERSGSLMRRLEEEVTVVGDESSNKLVISTSPRYMESVLKIVEELDQTPPQVMIQVLLAEVSVDSSEQWGMDVTVGPFGGEGYRVGSTAQGVGVATAIGVPNLSVTSADFGILIRALELQGKLEILSNPQVLANNNKEATIKVVEDIGLAGQTQRGFGSDTIVSTVERKDVGITLKVTPSISADGFVRMEIAPEISSLTQRTTQINRDQTAPIITKRTVDTVVTVKDGQSVVIGGLIQTADEQRRSKVPLIGDIPFFGIPFRTKQNTQTKTELLVILTPRVIPSDTANTDELVRDVTEQTVQQLNDPTRVEEFLERIRQEVKQQREKHGYVAPRRPPEPDAGEGSPEQPPDPAPGDPPAPGGGYEPLRTPVEPPPRSVLIPGGSRATPPAGTPR
ncbi:MAG: secretin N-terminal domain-containing protein [Planctomycetota bacterium]|nr:secretin N-terminal domain-containing protein [Planctomycetota bacterium]